MDSSTENKTRRAFRCVLQRVKKGISFRQNTKVQSRKISPLRLLFDCSDKGRSNWNALRPRGLYFPGLHERFRWRDCISIGCFDHESGKWNALRPRGPFLFRSAGKGSKRGRFARHFGSGKMEAREKLFGEPSQTQRLTAFQTHGKVRFCPCRARQGQKSPHEPRRKILRALPRPPDSAQRRIKMPVTKAIKSHAFCALFSSLRLYRQAVRRAGPSGASYPLFRALRELFSQQISG